MRLFAQRLAAAMCCSVCALAGCGGNGSVAVVPPAPVTPTPVTSAPTPTAPLTTTARAKFAYTGNQGASLSGYSVDISTGLLTALSGFPLPLGTNPTAVAVDPQNRFLLVADVYLSVLQVFNINSSTGALSATAASQHRCSDKNSRIAGREWNDAMGHRLHDPVNSWP